MNLLAFLWLVGCIAAVPIAFAMSDVWAAVADRIRNPKRSLTERILDGDAWPTATASTWTYNDRCRCGHSLWEHEPDNKCRVCEAINGTECSFGDARSSDT